MVEIENIVYKKVEDDFYEVGVYSSFTILFEGFCCKAILDYFIEKGKEAKADIHKCKVDSMYNDMVQENKQLSAQINKTHSKLRKAISILESI